MEVALAASAKQKPLECLTTVLLRERIARLAGQAQEDAQSSEPVGRGAVCLQALPKRLRWDAPPVVQDPRTGSRDVAMRVAADLGQVATALASFKALMYTPRSKLSKDGRRRFWLEMCEAARRRPFPLAPSVVTFGAAVLWAAGYRSARLYLVEAKIEHERQGFEVTSHAAITDAVRAVQRSSWLAGKPGEIRPEILNSFWSVTKRHPTKRRPLELAAGIHAWSFAAAFLLREVELCCLTLDEECISLDSVKCWVTLHLPPSKMDPRDRGARRTRACTCGTVRKGCPSCPYCSAVV